MQKQFASLNLIFCITFLLTNGLPRMASASVENTSTLSTIVPPIAAAANFTTTPDTTKYTWYDSLQAPVKNTVILKTTIQNGPLLSEAPYAIIALSEATNDTPAYLLHMAYQKTNMQYSIFIIKRNQGNMTQVITIQQASNPAAWAYLEAWRTGVAKPFTLSYYNGKIMLAADTFILWNWQDTAPIDGITRACLCSSGASLIYSASTVTSSITTLAAQTSEFLPITENSLQLTFTAATVPGTVTAKLYTNSTDSPVYELTFDTTNGCHIKVLQRTSPTTSDIPNSNGVYDLNSPVLPAAGQTYFLSYTNKTIAFGLLSNAQQSTTLFSWTNPSQTVPDINIVNISTTDPLSTLTLTRTPFVLTNPPSVGFTKQNEQVCTLSGMAKSAAYTAGSTNWNAPITFAQADVGAVEFTIQLADNQKTVANGAVILLGTQAQGQPLYGVIMEPSSETNTFGSNATSARFRLFSLENGTFQYLSNTVIINGHILDGRYVINYARTNATDATVSISKVGDVSNQNLANLIIPNASTGIKYMALSADRGPVIYRNVSTTVTPRNTPPSIAAAMSTITCLQTDGRTLNWDHSALQKDIDTRKGFTFETKINFDTTTPNKSLVFGFAQATVNTNDQFFFKLDKVYQGFNGAKVIMIVTATPATATKAESLDISVFKASTDVAGQKASVALDGASLPAISGSDHTLWITYNNQDDMNEYISIGLNTSTYTNPLYTWSNTKDKQGTSFTKNNFTRIGLGVWSTSVTYSSINVAPYSPPSTAPVIVVPTETPNATRTATATLVYDWNLGKTITNPTANLSPENGGYISFLVKLNITPTTSVATIMIGLSSDSTKTDSMRAENQSIFPGADYNIQLQAIPQSNTGIACLRRVSTSGDSLEENPQSVPDLVKLITTVTGSTVMQTWKVWARYAIQNNNRFIDVGIVPSTDTSDINTLKPIYSFIDPIDPAAPPAPIKQISVSSWNTAAAFTKISVVQNGPNAVPNPGAAFVAPITYDGTLSSLNFPSESQWAPTTTYKINPNTIHKFTASGDTTDKIVIALCKNKGSAESIAFRFVITATEITLYEGTEIRATSAAPLLGNLSKTITSYWLRADNKTISIGGYTGDATTPDKTPSGAYIAWTNDNAIALGNQTPPIAATLLSDAACWYFTNGASSGATFSYKKAEIIRADGTSPGSTMIRRSGAVASTTPRSTPNNRSPQNNTPSSEPSSDSLENSRYRRNLPVNAR